MQVEILNPKIMRINNLIKYLLVLLGVIILVQRFVFDVNIQDSIFFQILDITIIIIVIALYLATKFFNKKIDAHIDIKRLEIVSLKEIFNFNEFEFSYFKLNGYKNQDPRNPRSPFRKSGFGNIIGLTNHLNTGKSYKREIYCDNPNDVIKITRLIRDSNVKELRF